jgi:hypothetical protein
MTPCLDASMGVNARRARTHPSTAFDAARIDATTAELGSIAPRACERDGGATNVER